MNIYTSLLVALAICWACMGSAVIAADTPGANDYPVVTSKTGPIKIAKCEFILFSPSGNKANTLPALRITSEDGHEGYWVGESWMSQKPDAVQPVLGKLKGMDVSTPEEAYVTLSKIQMPFTLLLGLDIAIWDLFGRSQGKPVADLLGARKRDTVALYLAGVPNLDARQVVALAMAAKKRGAKAFKIYAYLDGYGPKRDSANAEDAAKWVAQDIALARAVREAVGDAFPLMFYNGCSYNLAQATQVGKVLDELHYSLYYDPMPENVPDSMANYLALKKSITTPICAPVAPAQSADRMTWMENKALDMNQVDVYAGFTPCLQVVRACVKAGVPVDLHGGFPSDYYQFPLYAFVDNNILPRIGWHLMNPKWLPGVAKDFPGSAQGDKNSPWIKRMQTRPVDADGFVHLNYAIPGMGVEFDWDWIAQHDIAAVPATPTPAATTPVTTPPVAPTPGVETTADTLVLPRVNAEAKGYIDMLRPFLEADYNPPSGPDKDRPSLKDAARKIAENMPAQLSVSTAPKRKILVLAYGTYGTLHIPGAAGLLSLLRDAATKYGAFELTELYSSDGIDAKLLSNFDAVVINNVGQNWKPQADKLYNEILPDYVKHGGGLFADHGAALLYMNKPVAEYNNLLGAFVEASPLLFYQVHTLKDVCSPFYIKLPEPDNPLAAAFHGETKPFIMQSCQLNGDKRVEWPVTFNTPMQLADELYGFSPHSNKDHATRVIVTLDVAKNTPGMYPAGWPAISHALVWMRPYGQGRVFYSELGHNQAIFSVPCVARMMLDGLQYATGDLKVPDIAVLPPDDDTTPATVPATTPATIPADPTAKPNATGAAPATAQGVDFVWVEGETPTHQEMHRFPQWYDQVDKSKLSGGDFISNWSADQAGTADYDVILPKDGTYAFWVHANPVATKLSYHIGDGDWQLIDFTNAQPAVNIDAEGKVNLKYITWCKVGDLTLKAGKINIAFKMSSENHNHGMLDCFVLSLAPFTPDGIKKPVATASVAAPSTTPATPATVTTPAATTPDVTAANQTAWLPWNPAKDAFTESPIDLRTGDE